MSLGFRTDNNTISQNANESIYFKLWFSLMDTFTKTINENINLLDATNEAQHKTTLLHQVITNFNIYWFLIIYL